MAGRPDYAELIMTTLASAFQNISYRLAGLGVALALLAGQPLVGAETLLVTDPVAGFAQAKANGCNQSLVPAQERTGQALRLVVPSKPAEGWMAHSFIYGLEHGYRAGDKIVVTLWARATEGGEGAIKVELGQLAKPYTSVIAKFVMPTAQWKQYTVEGVAAADLAGDQARFGFCVGYREQVVEIAEIVVKNLGQ